MAAIVWLLASGSAFGQHYFGVTVAGGGVPANVPARGTFLGRGVEVLAFDRAGNLLFTYDRVSILRLDIKSGMISSVAGSGMLGSSPDGTAANLARFNDISGMALDSKGNIYVSEARGNRIRRISHGIVTTFAGTGVEGFSGDGGPALDAQFYDPGNLAMDSQDNLYVVERRNKRIRRISNGIVTTVAGNGSATFSGDGGPALSASFEWPLSIAVDSSGAIYVGDVLSCRVRKISGGIINTVAGNGKCEYSGDNGPATAAGVRPTTIAVDGAGALYVADYFGWRIRKVVSGAISTAIGDSYGGFNGDNHPPADTQIDSPTGMAFDAGGNLWFAEWDNARINKVANGLVTTVAGAGPRGFTGEGGPATNSIFQGPGAIAFDSAGALYVLTEFSRRILRISNGVISTVAGNGEDGTEPYTGVATAIRMRVPSSIAVSPSGTIYLVDSVAKRVVKILNGVASLFAGGGPSDHTGEGGPASQAYLRSPEAVALDAAGNLYISDPGYSNIRKVSVDGIITTVVGSGEWGYAGDHGPATQASIRAPGGIAFDSAGNLYFADTVSHVVRKVSNGIITTVAGTGVAGFSGDRGPASAATLNHPDALATDRSGNLYIVDRDNFRIRKVTNGMIDTIAGPIGDTDGPDSVSSFAIPNSLKGGIAIDAVGNVYYSDTFLNRVYVLLPAGHSCADSVDPKSIDAPAGGGVFKLHLQHSCVSPWRVEGLPDWITLTSAPAAAGSVDFTLNIAAATEARSTTVSIAGTLVTVKQRSLYGIASGGVVNSAGPSSGAALAPGSIATAYGIFPGRSLTTASSVPLPTALAGVSLAFADGPSAPLFAVSEGQVNFQVPWELADRTEASISAVLGGQSTSPETVAIAPFAPAIFSTNAQGTGQGSIVDSNFRLVDSANPAIAGATAVQIYCTGLGPVTNQPATGQPALADPLSATTAAPMVVIGGAEARVLFSGLAPGSVGGYQVNVIVPAGSTKGPDVPVVLSIGGKTSNVVTIAVQ